LIKLKKGPGPEKPKVDDVTDADLKNLPKNVKDKLRDYSGKDKNTLALKNRLKNLNTRRELQDDEIDMTKVTKWFAKKLQTNGLKNLKADVEKNFSSSDAEFRLFTMKTDPKAIADAMNKNPKLRDAYVYPYRILKSGRMFQRDYLDGKVETLTDAIEKNLVTPLGNAFICLFCLWLMTVGYMITVIVCNCSGEEETEKENSHEIGV
jgi:hypothetical protein